MGANRIIYGLGHIGRFVYEAIWTTFSRIKVCSQRTPVRELQSKQPHWDIGVCVQNSPNVNRPIVSLCSDQSSAGAVRESETVYRRRPGLPSRRTHHLRHSAGYVISAPSLSTFRQLQNYFCSWPRSLTLSSIPAKLSPPPVDREVILSLLLGPL